MKISFQAKLSLAVAIILWSSAFVGIRAAFPAYSPGGLALLRFLVASVCMYFLYSFFAHKKVTKADKLYLLLVGAVGVGGYNVTLNYGELTVPSGIASFIISQSPIMTTIFAISFLNEHFNRYGIVGMLISLTGIIIILLSQNQYFHPGIGWFYIFAATVIAAAYSILQKKFLNKYYALDVTAYGLWGATLSLLFFLPDMVVDVRNAPLSDTLTVVYLGIFPAAIAYVAWNYALSELPVARTVNFLYLMPLIATFLGWAWLGEVPSVLSTIGGFVALTGVWLVNKSYHLQKLQKNVEF